MDRLTYYSRLEYILKLIKKGALSSPKEISYSLGCTEKTVRNMINSLRAEGHDISYSRRLKRYQLRQ